MRRLPVGAKIQKNWDRGRDGPPYSSPCPRPFMLSSLPRRRLLTAPASVLHTNLPGPSASIWCFQWIVSYIIRRGKCGLMASGMLMPPGAREYSAGGTRVLRRGHASTPPRAREYPAEGECSRGVLCRPAAYYFDPRVSHVAAIRLLLLSLVPYDNTCRPRYDVAAGRCVCERLLL